MTISHASGPSACGTAPAEARRVIRPTARLTSLLATHPKDVGGVISCCFPSPEAMSPWGHAKPFMTKGQPGCCRVELHYHPFTRSVHTPSVPPPFSPRDGGCDLSRRPKLIVTASIAAFN